MDFIDKIRELSARIPKQIEYIQTEEATKNALVMPFIDALGYSIFDPTEVIPEFTADLGTKKGETANFMTLGWLTRVNANPPLLAVGVNREHLTNELIRENKTFSINYPSANMVKKVDHCGLISGRKEDKSLSFTVEYGELETAPLIKECALSLECELVDIYEMATNDLFIGQIIASHAAEEILTDGKPDMGKLNPLLLTMPDNHYWSVGEKVGEAWSIGRKLDK
jgi:flavin reductase (DIM6/NTAB) family NADH-FMN oxidoreductase RutF